MSDLRLIKLTIDGDKKIISAKDAIMPTKAIYDIKVDRSHYKNGGTYITPGELSFYGINPVDKKVKPEPKPEPEPVVEVEKEEEKTPMDFGIPIPDDEPVMEKSKKGRSKK